jgi:hypothetical protein
MTTDDDPLTGIDLDVWQPPGAPDGLGDAVIRRMREPVPAAAHEIAERPRRRSWRWMAAAGAAIAAASLLVVAPWGSAPEPRDHGDVVADRPSHLVLGRTLAELDAGTELLWQRDQRRVTVVQRRGAVTWRVDSSDTIAIDAGAMGASVEASGASLRVEVSMHSTSSDNRVVATRAATAVAAALVTVIVYQGQVKASTSGQTVNIAAGSAVELRPGEPPRELHDVGAAPVTAPAVPGRPLTVAGVEPVPSQAGANAPAPRNIPPQELEAHRIRGAKNIVPDDVDKNAIAASGNERVIASFKLCVDEGGNVVQVALLKSSGFPGYDRKILSEMAGWQYSPVEIDGKPVRVCSAVTFIYSQK